jgi:hypothetical protein
LTRRRVVISAQSFAMIARHVLFLAGLGLASGLTAHAANSLAPSSPFLPPASAGTASTENTPLELRGILVDEGGYRFGVFDPAKHTGTWVRLNEPGHDFIIRSHDVARDMVTLDFQGRVMTLPLHTSKVTAAPVFAAPPSGNAPVVLNPTPADEVARFNRVKEEIARRRALREQANGQGPQPRR